MDENLKSFENRLRRVDPDFKPSVWRRMRVRPRRGVVVPGRVAAYAIVFVYIALTSVKVVMEHQLGPEGYDARVAQLAAGDETARIAARLMFRDPIMTYVSREI